MGVATPKTSTWLPGGDELNAFIRMHDWAATPLGPIERWPQSLKTAAGIMLTTRHPAIIYWGPDLLCLYNAAFAASLGPEKHPAILGQPAWQAWPEAFALFAAELQQVMAGGEATWQENHLIPILRYGRIEDVYWTYSCSPILDPDVPNGVGGVLVLITETTQDIVARRDSEAHFQAVANLVPDLLWRSDAEGNACWFNDRWYDYTGQTPEEAQGHGWRAVIHPEDREELLAASARAIAERQSLTWEARLRRWDREHRWFLVRSTNIYGADGQLVQRFGAATDIHDQRLTREALAESEERLRLGMEVAGFGTYDINLVTGALVFSPELREIYGLAPDEPITEDRLTTTLVHPEDRERVIAVRNAARDPAGPGCATVEYRIVRLSGDVRWLQLRSHIFFAGEGKARRVVRSIGAVQDITERKLAEQRLAASEERLRLAQELSGIGSFDWDPVRDEAQVSDVYRQILGLPSDWRESTRNHSKIVHPDDLASFRAAVDAAVAGNVGFNLEYRVIRPSDHQLRWIHARGGAIRDKSGHPVRFAGIISDITERKQAQEREQLLMQEVDHRAKNLLSVIQSMVALTQAPSTEAFVAAVKDRIQSLARAHTLLANSRWEGADLWTLVHEELLPFGPESGRITISGPSVELKPAAAQSMALALHELTTNAAKYGALSTPQGRVSVSWGLNAASDELNVRWQERGGPPVAPPRRKGFGSIAIRAGIEHQLGGRVHMDWQPEGLVCIVTLPARQVSRAPLATAANQPSAPC